jgi:xanthine dehydrogenase YagT iron-sulfur-binding subunit
VLVVVDAWEPPGEHVLRLIRAELRCLGAALLVISEQAIFCFRPDDTAPGLDLGGDPRGPQAHELLNAFGLAQPKPGELTLACLDDAGRERYRTTAPATPGLPEALLGALTSAGKRALAAQELESEPLTVSTLAGARLSRRESIVLCLVGALAAMLAESCKSAPSTPQKPPPRAAGATTHEREVVLRVNGAERRLKLEPRVSLLDALRERIGLTGTKKGCDHGQCGACTVLVEGRRVNACLTLAVMVENKAITTIEGLANGTKLHPLQEAFVSEDALQCGYCTPGQIMSALALLQEGYAVSDDEVREGMSGNICRCGAYSNIVRAVQSARKAGTPT